MLHVHPESILLSMELIMMSGDLMQKWARVRRGPVAVNDAVRAPAAPAAALRFAIDNHTGVIPPSSIESTHAFAHYAAQHA